jgi:hypothetical protein
MTKVPTRPQVWHQARLRARATDAGSPPGRWSARKAVLAQVSYKKRGGRWEILPDESGDVRAGADGEA